LNTSDSVTLIRKYNVARQPLDIYKHKNQSMLLTRCIDEYPNDVFQISFMFNMVLLKLVYTNFNIILFKVMGATLIHHNNHQVYQVSRCNVFQYQKGVHCLLDKTGFDFIFI